MTGTPRRLKLGTRRSPLALAQSGQVARALETLHPGLTVELVPIETRGDRTPGDLAALGGKGLFTEELERGLLDGALDFAVHSLKDLPVALPEGLTVAAYPERADPRDVLVSEVAKGIDTLPEGAIVLTGSLRRKAQILLARPDLDVHPLRGNVDTRLRKWKEQGAGGVILAAAGLARLGVTGIPAHPIPVGLLLPAPGQGILALEVKAGGPADDLCRALDHPPSRRAAEAERKIVAAFGADCTLPLAAFAEEGDGGNLRLRALLASPDGRSAAHGEGVGADPAQAAERCVAAMKADGGDAVLAGLRLLR